VGITPRTFARINQFNRAMNKLETGDFKRLSDLAYATSYADQAHFTRSFKAFTGLTPKAFLEALEQ